MAELFTGHVASEFLYLETRWASLISFGLTVALLKDVLPVAGTTNPETVRQHLHRVANRHEADLGGEPAGSGDDAPTAGQLPVARGAAVVGIDGGLASTYPGLTRLAKAKVELATDIQNNAAAVTDYAARWDHGEVISPFAESTVNLVVSRRFAKGQPMQWSKTGPIGSCRHEPGPSTARCATCLSPGIRPCPPTVLRLRLSLPRPEQPSTSHGP